MSRSRIIAGKAVIVIEAKDMLDKTLTGLRNKMHKFANTMGDIGENLLRTGFFGSIASGGILRQFMKFDDLMLTLQTDLNMFGHDARKTEPALASLEKKIRELGQTTSFSALEIVEAASRLAKANIPAEGIEKMLESVLALARATGTETAQATDIFLRSIFAFTSSTEDFNVKIAEAQKLASAFVLATRAGVIDLDNFDYSLRYSQSTAANLGLELNELNATLTVLSNRGMVGATGGTSFNTLLSQLSKKRPQIEELGGVFYTANDGALQLLPTLRSLFEVIEKSAGGDLTKKQALFQDIFNLRGARAAGPLAIKGMLDEIEALTKKLNEATNQAEVTSAIIDSKLGGAFRRLYGTLFDLGLTISETVEEPLTRLLQTIKELVKELAKLAKQNPVITGSILLSPVAILGAGLAFVALSKAIRLTAGALGLLKAAYSPIANLLTKGTVGQISNIAALAKYSTNTVGAQRKAALNRILDARQSLSAAKTAKEIKAATTSLKAARKAAKAVADPTRSVRNPVAVEAKMVALKIKAAETSKRTAAISRLEARGTYFVTKAQQQAATSLAKLQRAQATYRTALTSINKELAKNSQLVNLNNARYRQQLIIEAKLVEQRRQLANLKGLARAFPSSKILQRDVAANIQRLTAQRTQLVRGRPYTPREELAGALRARTALQARRVQIEERLNRTARGRIAIAAKERKDLAVGQNMLAKASVMNTTRRKLFTDRVVSFGRKSPTETISLFTKMGRGLTMVGTKFVSFARGMFVAANAIRRFVFSAGGILTIIESLLLFTDVGDRVARAFGGMFREIGKIGTYASGPMELFKVAFEAFKQQDTATGMQALTNGFSLLVDIIGTQLVAALAAFKKGLGPVWDTLRAIGTTIVVLMDAAVASIGAALTGVSQVVSSVASGLSSSTPEGAIAKLKGLKGKNTKDLLGTQSTTASVAQSIISAILEAVRQQEYFIADMTALLRNFINDLKTVLFPTNLLGYAENRREIEDDRNLAKSAADTRLNNALELVNAAFTRSAELEGGEALANANKAAREAMNEALDRAKELAKQIADNRLTVQAPDGGAPPTPQKQAQQVKDAAKEGLRSLAALVGFAGDTRRNVLLYGQDLEKKQVELLKDIRDDQRKQMQNEGILFTQ